jgi:uncharacterized membrane protein YfcA
MSMTDVLLILAGLVAGFLSGMVGVGGGVILVPILVLLFGFGQKEAQGTTLAMLMLPVGVLAAITYYKAGYVHIKAALWIAAGFIVGAYLGSHYAVRLPEHTVTRIFGGLLLAVGVKLFFFTK